ncbi:MAG: SH3 domain-containing protein, partial [Akkermansiaceae bacterium]|nr:SH3 domain-containing protein [Akkermansiaceae bacterium]
DELALRAQPKIEAAVVATARKGDELRFLEKGDGWAKVWRKGEEPVWAELQKEVEGQAETTVLVREFEGIEKTSAAFGQKVAFFPKILAIAVLLFA